MARRGRHTQRDKGVRELLGKPRWRAEDGRTVLEAQARSGLSLAGFARHHGLSVSRLYACARRCRQGASVPAAQFLPVRIVDRPAPVDSDALEIVLRGGRRLRVPSDFDAMHLQRVIEALEAASC